MGPHVPWAVLASGPILHPKSNCADGTPSLVIIVLCQHDFATAKDGICILTCGFWDDRSGTAAPLSACRQLYAVIQWEERGSHPPGTRLHDGVLVPEALEGVVQACALVHQPLCSRHVRAGLCHRPGHLPAAAAAAAQTPALPSQQTQHSGGLQDASGVI